MAAGKLRERVIFESRTPDADGDGAGNFEQGFVERFRCAAQITPLKGGEAVQASRLSGVQPCIIRVRYSSASRQVTPDWRILNARLNDTRGNPVAYNIRSGMNTDEKREYLDFMCESGVAT
jgi:SPP1 family predicted phage head-tail adaptor